MYGDKSRPSSEEDPQPIESLHHLHQIHHAAGDSAAAVADTQRIETEDAGSDLGRRERTGEGTSSSVAAASSP